MRGGAEPFLPSVCSAIGNLLSGIVILPGFSPHSICLDVSLPPFMGGKGRQPSRISKFCEKNGVFSIFYLSTRLKCLGFEIYNENAYFEISESKLVGKNL